MIESRYNADGTNLRVEYELIAYLLSCVIIEKRNLDLHMKSSHTSQTTSSCRQCGKFFSRSDNMKRDERTCTTVAAHTHTPAATAVRPTGKLRFALQQTRKALGGDAEQFNINMKEAKRLLTLEKAINVFKPSMTKFQ